MGIDCQSSARRNRERMSYRFPQGIPGCDRCKIVPQRQEARKITGGTVVTKAGPTNELVQDIPSCEIRPQIGYQHA